MSFTDKVVIVTGSSSGIGAATAIAFAKEGAKVTIVGRNATKLKSVSDTVAKTGRDYLVVSADVSSDEDCKRIIQSTVDKFGKIDVLVNNAGIIGFGALIPANIMDTFDKILNTNLRSAVLLTSLATPYLIETKGNIVNVSSVAGSTPPRAPFHAYSVSKVALDHFTKGAASELAASGVRVNVVSPGPVKTDIIENGGLPATWDDFAADTALGRASDSEEVSDLILFLASDKAKGITGSNYITDNGFLIKR